MSDAQVTFSGPRFGLPCHALVCTLGLDTLQVALWRREEDPEPCITTDKIRFTKLPSTLTVHDVLIALTKNWAFASMTAFVGSTMLEFLKQAWLKGTGDQFIGMSDEAFVLNCAGLEHEVEYPWDRRRAYGRFDVSLFRKIVTVPESYYLQNPEATGKRIAVESRWVFTGSYDRKITYLKHNAEHSITYLDGLGISKAAFEEICAEFDNVHRK